jgi:hemerythrin-like metal-binding protein
MKWPAAIVANHFPGDVSPAGTKFQQRVSNNSEPNAYRAFPGGAMSINSAYFGRIQMQHLFVNNLIQWGDHFSVEHPGIDAQHKAIFDLGADVYENWRSGGTVDVLRPVVDKLADLLRAHFSYEERLLVEIGYSGLDEHVAEHHSMLNDLVIMQERFHTFRDGYASPGGSLLAPGWPIMQFILGFTVGHVMSSDMSYSRTLIASRNHVQGTA